MLPAYSLVIASVIFNTKKRFVSTHRSNPYEMTRSFVVAFGTLCLTIGVALPAYVFPVFKFEKPTGSYAVGTVSRYWIDHSRHRDRPRGALNRFQNTFQVEELASHGYIVVGIDHSYVSAGTVFPDGRLAQRIVSITLLKMG
jgi:hypothetical protein